MIFFYLLISVMPLVQHPFWSQLVGEFTMVKLTGGVCLLFAIIELGLRNKAPKFFLAPQSRFFVAFMLLAIMSYLTMGGAYVVETSPVMSLISFLMLFFITLALVNSEDRLRYVVLACIGSVAFASLYVIREWQKFGAVYKEFRPGSFVTGDPNYYSISALICLPLAYYLLQDKQPRWERWFCLGCLAISLIGVTLAASRGGFLGLVAGLLFLIWRSQKRLRNLALGLAIILPLGLLAPSSPLDRLLNPTRSDQVSTDVRTKLWAAGARIITENPVVGIGLGNFKPMVSTYMEPSEELNRIAHNTYIELGAELGIPGLLLYLAILGVTYRSMGRVRKSTEQTGPLVVHRVAQGLQVGLVAFVVSISFVSAQYQKLFWLLMFVSMSLPALVTESKKKRVEVRSWRQASAIATQGRTV